MTAAALQMEDVGIESFADELKPGARLLLGQFKIESFLNAGGFGITYIARDSLDRRVVVKECFPSAFCRRTDGIVSARSRQRQDEFRSIVQLFLQEALNLSKLNHPNIVKVHQVFQDNQTAYMAMDRVDGPDLLDTIEGKAPKLPPAQIMLALTKMLDALGYVHRQGFLHRDISPDNILLDTTTGEPVLIDFGAARKDVTRKSRALSGLRVVKDGYSPQEFYISGSKQTPSSDLYALAATFSHLVSGEAPKTSQERLSAIANRDGDPQRSLVGRVKGYPAVFLASIDKAMAIFPKDRLQSAEEWLAMLNPDAGAPLAAAPVAATPSALPPLPMAPTAEAALPADVITDAAPVAAPAAQPPVTRPVTLPVVQTAMRPERALLRAVTVPAVAAALLLAGVTAVPTDLWARLGVTQGGAAGLPAVTAQADGPFALRRVVRLPYAAVPGNLAGVAARAPWSPGWIQPGQRIVEVNGTPVQDADTIPGLMAADADLSTVTELNVIFGFEDRPGGDIVNKMATLPVVDQLQLAGGYRFDIETTPTGIRTVVAGLPEGASNAGAAGLLPGDVLLAYSATGETLGTATALREILLRETANEVATYTFAIQRDAEVTVGSFTLPVSD